MKNHHLAAGVVSCCKLNLTVAVRAKETIGSHVRTQRGNRGSGPPPKNKNRVSLQYWSGSSEKSQTTKQALNVGPSSGHVQRAIW